MKIRFSKQKLYLKNSELMAGFLRIITLLILTIPFNRALAREWDKLTEKEKNKLLQGEVIYQSVKSTDAEDRLSGYGQSLAVVNAPIEKCWEIFTQYEQQQEYFPRKTLSRVIDQKPGLVLVQKEFKFYWAKIKYVNQYKIDPKNFRIDFQIDQTYPHDLKDSAGFFLFEKISPDTTLFIYAVTKLDTGIKTPQFIQNYIQKRDLPAVAENVRKRIESNGTWKKQAE